MRIDYGLERQGKEKSYREQWEELVDTCFKKLKVKTVAEIEEMTFEDITYRIEAYKQEQVDLEYDRHWRAFLNLKVQSQKESADGSVHYVYANFKDFFDKDKVEKMVFGLTEEDIEEEIEQVQKEKKMKSLMYRANKIK